MDSRINYYLNIDIVDGVDEKEYKDLITKFYNKNPHGPIFYFLDILKESNFGCEIVYIFDDSIGVALNYGNTGGDIIIFGKYKITITQKCYKDQRIFIEGENILDLHGNKADIRVCEILDKKWYIDFSYSNDVSIYLTSEENESEYASYDINKLIEKYKEVIN